MLNQVTIQGKMCKDAEDKQLPSGNFITTFCVACQRNYKNSNGQYEADFIDCIAFDKTGELIGKYFKKGSEIIISGELQTRTFKDNNGVNHKSTVLKVDKFFFESRPKTENQQSASVAPAPAYSEPEVAPASADMPFDI